MFCPLVIMPMWHGINVEMAICCFVWTINISCDGEVCHLLFFIIQHNGRLTICTNVQCTIMMILDFSKAWRFFCFVIEFVKSLDLGDGFYVMLLILKLWCVVYWEMNALDKDATISLVFPLHEEFSNIVEV